MNSYVKNQDSFKRTIKEIETFIQKCSKISILKLHAAICVSKEVLLRLICTMLFHNIFRDQISWAPLAVLYGASCTCKRLMNVAGSPNLCGCLPRQGYGRNYCLFHSFFSSIVCPLMDVTKK